MDAGSASGQPGQAIPDGPAPTCSLPGCAAPIVRQERGGRPKLYCSDAHRALARRQRLREGPGGQGERAARAVSALRQAAALVEEALTASTAGLEAQLAELRAQGTAQVLEAQRVAADATRQLADARQRFQEEAGRLEAALRGAHEREAAAAARIDELQAALEGARAELEDELLQHHRDVRALQEARASLEAR